ncbi:MAG: flagellar assembly protein FliW [Chitinispirillales bacterium]|jgi:flagellar assembly factor FliW|nr:flagellar assembly protein FliW [Chitinispirillales bacterium]
MSDFFENLVFSPEDVITFPGGIPGFEEHTRFVIVPMPECEPFSWLACVDGAGLRFAIINPLIFVPDYTPQLSKEQLWELEISNLNDLVLYAIVTIGKNPIDSTANLAGPIIINKPAKLGKQALIDDDSYGTQVPIFKKDGD